MTFKEMNKYNTSYEDYEKACYERAKIEMDVQYAIDGLDYAKKHNGIMDFYKSGKSVDSAVYLLCY